MADWRDYEPKFWERVEKTDWCWIWTGPRSPGDNRYAFRPSRKFRAIARRYAWALEHGHMPDGRMQFNLRCGNPRCVRPDHLYVIADERRGWVDDGVGYIPLTQGEVAIVDPDMVPRLSQFVWFITPSGYAARNPSKSARVRRQIYMHRTICRASADLEVDHANHNKLDNRRANLRPATCQQNAANAPLRSDNTSGYRGVTRCTKTGRWQARVGRSHVGRFDTPEEAARAYNSAARVRFGEFAFQNAIPEEEANASQAA